MSKLQGLRNKVKLAWENKEQIAEGLFNTYINNTKEIADIAEERIATCRSNVCGLYDKNGSSSKAVLPGAESCAGCGCVLNIKKNCMSCHCYLGDIDPITGKPYGIPLWEAVMTAEQESTIHEIARKKQEEKNQQL